MRLTESLAPMTYHCAFINEFLIPIKNRTTNLIRIKNLFGNDTHEDVFSQSRV